MKVQQDGWIPPETDQLRREVVGSMKTPGRKRWVKILLNPVLTKFGWIIVSEFSDNGRFVGFKFTTYPEHCRGDFSVWLKVRL